MNEISGNERKPQKQRKRKKHGWWRKLSGREGHHPSIPAFFALYLFHCQTPTKTFFFVVVAHCIGKQKGAANLTTTIKKKKIIAVVSDAIALVSIALCFLQPIVLFPQSRLFVPICALRATTSESPAPRFNPLIPTQLFTHKRHAHESQLLSKQAFRISLQSTPQLSCVTFPADSR